MKNTLLFLISLLMVIVGCKKSEQKYCWVCHNLTINQPGQDTIVNITGKPFCDQTQSQINSFIKANTFTQQGTYGHTQYSSETCTKQ